MAAGLEDDGRGRQVGKQTRKSVLWFLLGSPGLLPCLCVDSRGTHVCRCVPL